jgi:hypothetical protein
MAVPVYDMFAELYAEMKSIDLRLLVPPTD